MRFQIPGCILVSLAVLPVFARAGIGDMDMTYGAGGRVAVNDQFGALGDGSLVYSLGSGTANVTDYAHLDVNGQPDPLFGVAGRLTLPVSAPTDTVGTPARTLRTPAGQLLMSIRAGGYLGVLRLDATGYPDASFGTAGIANIVGLATQCANVQIDGLALQPDGHLLALTSSYGTAYGDEVLLSSAIRRFSGDGVLDANFANGASVVNFRNLNGCTVVSGLEGSSSLAVLNDGAMAVTLISNVMYLSADGSPMNSAPRGTGLRTDVNEWHYAGALPSGGSLLSGVTPGPSEPAGNIVIARLRPDGSLDTSFGGTGYTQLNMGTLSVTAASAAESVQDTFISADGNHIYVAVALTNTEACGAYCAGTRTGVAVARLLANGSDPGTLDTTFGHNGVVLLTTSGSFDVSDIVEQPGGAAVVLTSGGLVIRLLGSGTPSPGVVEFASDPASALDADGVLRVRVARRLGKDGPISVDYATSDVPTVLSGAVAGTDYTAVTGQLTWADGDNADKFISIPVFDLGPSKGDRMFTVRLSLPTGGTWIPQAETTAIIQNSNQSVAASPAASATATTPTQMSAGGGGSFDWWSLSLLWSCWAWVKARKSSASLEGSRLFAGGLGGVTN